MYSLVACLRTVPTYALHNSQQDKGGETEMSNGGYTFILHSASSISVHIHTYMYGNDHLSIAIPFWCSSCAEPCPYEKIVAADGART